MFKISILIAIVFLGGCATKQPMDIGVVNGIFSACPETPNCINSQAENEAQKIDGFLLNTKHPSSWKRLVDMVDKIPRSKITHQTGNYIHAEISSALWGFIDDLQLYLTASDNHVAIKSAARSGYTDFGVNRKRLENLRQQLIKNQIIKK